MGLFVEKRLWPNCPGTDINNLETQPFEFQQSQVAALISSESGGQAVASSSAKRGDPFMEAATLSLADLHETSNATAITHTHKPTDTQKLDKEETNTSADKIEPQKLIDTIASGTVMRTDIAKEDTAKPADAKTEQSCINERAKTAPTDIALKAEPNKLMDTKDTEEAYQKRIHMETKTGALDNKTEHNKLMNSKKRAHQETKTSTLGAKTEPNKLMDAKEKLDTEEQIYEKRVRPDTETSADIKTEPNTEGQTYQKRAYQETETGMLDTKTEPNKLMDAKFKEKSDSEQTCQKRARQKTDKLTEKADAEEQTYQTETGMLTEPNFLMDAKDKSDTTLNTKAELNKLVDGKEKSDTEYKETDTGMLDTKTEQEKSDGTLNTKAELNKLVDGKEKSEYKETDTGTLDTKTKQEKSDIALNTKGKLNKLVDAKETSDTEEQTCQKCVSQTTETGMLDTKTEPKKLDTKQEEKRARQKTKTGADTKTEPNKEANQNTDSQDVQTSAKANKSDTKEPEASEIARQPPVKLQGRKRKASDQETKTGAVMGKAGAVMDSVDKSEPADNVPKATDQEALVEMANSADMRAAQDIARTAAAKHGHTPLEEQPEKMSSGLKRPEIMDKLTHPDPKLQLATFPKQGGKRGRKATKKAEPKPKAKGRAAKKRENSRSSQTGSKQQKTGSSVGKAPVKSAHKVKRARHVLKSAAKDTPAPKRAEQPAKRGRPTPKKHGRTQSDPFNA